MDIRTPAVARAALVVVLGAALAACTSGAADSGPPSAGASPSAARPPATSARASTPSSVHVTAPSTSSSSSATSSSATSPSSSAAASSPSAATAPTCLTSALRAAVADSGAAAGTIALTISLTNTGTHPCTLRGFPEVSLVRDGVQLGAPATRDTGDVTTVRLPAGGSTTFGLFVVQALNYPEETCRPRTADGFRIYPPGSRAALFLADSGITGCTSTSVTLLRVRPVGVAL